MVRASGIFLMVVLAAAAAAQAQVREVVEAELAFARFTGEHGVRDGFLAFLAPDAVVFRPGPVPGREAYAKVPPGPAVLSWYPEAADRSASGEMGYTTGPYELFKSRSEKAASAWGHFVTLWKKQSDGTWKAALDAGVSHAAPSERAPLFTGGAAAGPAAPDDPAAAAASGKRLAGLELDLQSDYDRKIGPLLSPQARACRDNVFPAVGGAAAAALIARETGVRTWKQAGLSVSASGDLAYVYGTAERLADGPDKAGPRGCAFLRIWKKAPGADWRVVLDLATSL